ncbi:Glycosyltransferase involved in cell wall bisynthesis [Mucilaginibacter sp. OK268]|uniref:glycosyltransferase family 4 protein n=1 Tax=Mucilaginibacter sp. OK268 TaxID=1881048 RepID=UPI0008907D87|nr:glycosyltransferase family 4 protein [Mucilaginibacter sp. OK268]SDQ00422.1 Glycosyltransferase involved in cell wall bisynthesis [Mucilaginibacter sp. OK268]
MRLAIIATHPVQYYAPVFKLLAESPDMEIRVFYTWGEKAIEKFDPGFGQKVDWDIPLLQDYDFEWVSNTASDPGSHHRNGIINPGLIDQMNQWQPNALLVFGWAYHSHLKAIRHYHHKLPIYFRGDSTLIDVKPGIRAFLRSVFLKWVYRHIDHAFYVGTNNKTYFKKYGLKDKQLTFAPHAIDNERFSADRYEEALKLRQSLGITDNDTLVLFAGKFEDKKSPQLLIDAFLALNKPAVHLLLVGGGILEIPLKTRASINKRIHFMDFQNQSFMPVVYQAADLFCLPSKGPGETWGLAVNEAMAAGTPVLISNKVGCAADLVIPGFTGDIFDSENLSDITEKLGDLLKDRSRLKALGANAQCKIVDWSFDKQVAAILNTVKHNYAN